MSLSKDFTVIINTKIDESLRKEGLVRELIRSVQSYRKELNLPVEQRVNISFDVSDNLKNVIESFDGLLRTNLLVNKIEFRKIENMKYVTIEKETVGIYFH